MLVTAFETQLLAYKQAIDADIVAYSARLRRQTLEQYGANARLEIDAYLAILERGGKRIRGTLVMHGYKMSGGTDTDMIVQAARAIEMIHAYILIIDDFQDKSATRRAGPTAHTSLTQHHRAHELAGSSEHFGASIAINAALSGAHAAQSILASLGVEPELRLRAITAMNSTMVVTAHGQTNDIMNEVVSEVSDADIERVLEWKTAHYTFLNPLSIGMILAGASGEELNNIREYALCAGKAFQLTDDLLGTFGTEFASGKSPMDDIREGKRTLLIAHALKHVDNSDKNFLVRMLGNVDITPMEFERVKAILHTSGALAHTQKLARLYAERAVSAQSDDFLRQLVLSLQDRVK